MIGRMDRARQLSWRKINAAYGEIGDMKRFLVKIRGGRLTRLARCIGLLAPPNMEAAVLNEISFLQEDILRMRRAYADNLRQE